MKFKKLLPAILCVFLALAFTGCTKDDDDDQEYLVEYGVITEEDYNKNYFYHNNGFYFASYEEIYLIKTKCKYCTIEDTYEKEIMDEHDLRFLAADIPGLTESQIDMMLESPSAIYFFNMNNTTNKM